MTTISIPLADDKYARLKALADRAGVSPEELVLRQVEEALQRPDEELTQAADYILHKNAELYRRLA